MAVQKVIEKDSMMDIQKAKPMDEKKVDDLVLKLVAMMAEKKVEPMVHKMEKTMVAKTVVKKVQR